MTELSNNSITKSSDLPAKSFKLRLLALAIIILLIAVGFLVSRHLLTSKPKVKRRKPAKMQTLVKVMTANKISSQIKIKALGRVFAAHEINLQARISGTVVFVHENFIPGGIIAKDDELVRIDDADYRLILQQKKHALAQAKADLRIEQGKQKVAEQEWQVINEISKNLDSTSKDLALRTPQLNKAKTSIQSAIVDIKKAKIDLDRTKIRAPFNAVIRQKSIDYGSQVSSQSSIATLTGIDEFYVELSLPVEKLAWISLPSSTEEPSKVEILANNTKYQAEITHLQPDLDKDGLMAKIIIKIPDPLGTKSNKTPLLLGSFVQANISGKTIDNVYKIPLAALKDGKKVLIATPENRLHIQPVSILAREKEYVLIDQGINQNDLIIISNVAAQIDKMELKIDNSDLTKPSSSRSNK